MRADERNGGASECDSRRRRRRERATVERASCTGTGMFSSWSSRPVQWP